MAGVPPIPPLLCNTPPPIDFGDEDDDSGLPPTLTLDEDEFGEFALGVDINEDAMNVEASSLPRTPLPFEVSSSTTSGFTDVAPTLEDCGVISITPPELSISPTHEEIKTKVQLNEAFNYNVVQNCATETEASQFNDNVKKLVEENENPGTKNTSTPSKADYNHYITDSNDAKIATAAADVQIELKAEKLTGTPDVQEFESERSKAVQDTEIKPNTAPISSQSPPASLTGLVQLEDLADDSSDEECHRSPKKTPISPISTAASNEDSNSDDFFAIHVIDEPTSPKEDKLSPIAEDINMNNFSNQNNNIINDVENEKNSNLTVANQQSDDDDFGDFADFESATDFIKPATASVLSTSDFVDSNKNIKVEEPPRDSNSSINDNNVDDDDFDDFQDFTAAPISDAPIATATSETNTSNITAKSATDIKCAISTDSAVVHTEIEVKPIESVDIVDDDDDFGDFEEATFAAPSNTQSPPTTILQTQMPLNASGNVNERLGTVLKMMFPVEDEGIGDEIQDQVKTNVTKDLPNLKSQNAKLPFEAIEAAKALEFQWPQSEMRHALIRSIGIDSRNILFGDNWNPSMPRFAANLSFNPLKPMKPQSANNTTPVTYAGVDTMPYGGGGSSTNPNAAELDMNSYAKRTDVPDVEFDWQGADLVNPLDASQSHAHTLLLDLDQVMVMATKLDNLNVDSSSYSFSECATLEHIKIPTITTTTTCITATTITTANNKLTNQMQRFNLIPINTKKTTTTTTIPTPAFHTFGQLSSSPSHSSLNINNNSSTYANSTRNFSLNIGRNVMNTYENNGTYPNFSTNPLTTQCTNNTTHVNAELNAFHTPYTCATINSLVTQRSVAENRTNNESVINFKNITNHFLTINHDFDITSMNNKNMNNNNNNTLNSNSNTRFIMSNSKITQSSSNYLFTPTLIWADFCNNSNMLNKPLECANFHLNPNRLPDCSRVKGEANTRETETIHPSPPTTRLDTPDDQHQSDTTYSNIDDNISETLSKNERNELRSSPTRDTCPSPLTLDNTAYQFKTQDQGINMNVASNSGSSSAASSISNIKSYNDNSKTITALRLGANAMVADDADDDETVVTSTYAGPLKETHIYTPSKTELAATAKAGKSILVGSEPIDFDYEIAAAGIIIDEKVVKKEYRDVEYNPGFSLDVVNEYSGELTLNKTESFGVVSSISALPITPTQTQQRQQPQTGSDFDTDEFTEFTEFQSVPPPSAVQAAMPTTEANDGHTMSTSTITSKFPTEPNTKTTLNSLPPVLPAAVTKAKEASNTPSRTNSPSIIDTMILSPAILLPQAIPMNSNNATTATKAAPTIEWGNSTANINPDELARIEELFSQPKISSAGKDAANSSQKSTPTHTFAESQAKSSTISISASVALKEQDSTLNDDYWSEFVSVPVASQQQSNNANRLNNNSAGSSYNNNNNKNNNNNNQAIMLSKRMGDLHISNSNNAMRSPRHHQQQQQHQHQHQHNSIQRTLTPTPQQKSIVHSANFTNNSSSNSNSNDDDWSDFVSSTPTPAAAPTQHANTYMPAAHAPQFNSAAWQNANFYNNPLGLYHQQATMQMRSLTPQQQQLQLQQQIHIMQDFSTTPISNRPQSTMHNSNNSTNINNMQHSNTYSPLQVGNARVAPSISLIPDLGFVAPALPVHTAFVNVLPKTSFNSKK